MDAAEYGAAVAEVSERALEALKEPRSTWDLKIELKVPHTVLHLALGRLLAEGKIALRPEGYVLVAERVRSAAPTAA